MLRRFKSVSMLLFLGGLSTGIANALPSNGVNASEILQQSSPCKGVVKDTHGETVIGASIVVKGTVNGTITDFDGNFTLENVKEGDIIQISFIGYATQEIKWTGKPLNVILKDDTKTLEEVVVVGFGTQKKVDLTGAVSQVKMEKVLGDRPVVNATAALQGAIPGLQVSGGSKVGGQQKSFNIRGQVSLNGGGPLVLIDNVEGDISALNPDDIESVSVLKDAASSAIYGARAAGGVILITTKRPAKGTKFQFKYGISQGWEKAITTPQHASLDQFLDAYKEAGFSEKYYAGNGSITRWQELLGSYRAGTLDGVYDNGIYQDADGSVYYLKEGNPQETAMETGSLTNHNVSVSGGTDKLRFRLSGNFSVEDGPRYTSKDKYVRKALNSFISADITKWYTQELTMYYTDSRKSEPKNLITEYDILHSWWPDGYMSKDILGTEEDVLMEGPRNSLIIAPTQTIKGSTPRFQFKSIFKPLKDWTITVEYTYNQHNSKYRFYKDRLPYASVQLGVKHQPSLEGKDTYTVEDKVKRYNALNIYTNYNLTLGKHKLGVMAGFNQEKNSSEMHKSTVEGQAVPNVPSFGGGTGLKYLDESYQEYAIRGAFGRLTYNYDEKYLVTMNARYDGSSKFPKDNRFGFFPSISVGWRMGQEKFMSWAKDWLGDFKLRGSYGSIGNQSIAPYLFVPKMGIDESNVWLDGGNKVIQINTAGLVRSNFTWETVSTLDFGFDLSAFKGRLTSTFDWYQRDTKDMLSAGMELPSLVGAAAPQQNVADMRTKGWELAVNWRDNIGDWRYNIGFNLYDHKTKITAFDNKTGALDKWAPGRDLNEVWGYVADGYYSIDDFDLDKAKEGAWVLKEGVVAINGTIPQPGDVKYKDLDGDGIITSGANTLDNPGDRKVIGNDALRMQYGANMGVGYKGFDLNVMLQGVGKKDVWISNGKIMYPFSGGSEFGPLLSHQTDYWQAISYDPNDPNFMVAKNPNAELFRIYDQMKNSNSNTRQSTKNKMDASYLRIKNVTLSYNFPREWINKLSVNQLRLYVSVENLATFSSLPDGVDPENLKWEYPFYRTWSVGANITF